jgi:hypothetical protein
VRCFTPSPNFARIARRLLSWPSVITRSGITSVTVLADWKNALAAAMSRCVHLDVRLVNVPAFPNLAASATAQTFSQCRREHRFPVADGLMAEHDAAYQEHLRKVAQDEFVAQRPEHHERDDVRRILRPVPQALAALVELFAAGATAKFQNMLSLQKHFVQCWGSHRAPARPTGRFDCTRTGNFDRGLWPPADRIGSVRRCLSQGTLAGAARCSSAIQWPQFSTTPPLTSTASRCSDSTTSGPRPHDRPASRLFAIPQQQQAAHDLLISRWRGLTVDRQAHHFGRSMGWQT